MSVTAVVTNHNYGRYLRRCLDSAIEFCDEVLVFDDGSTDDSLAILNEYPVFQNRRRDASGDPVWGSNRGIEMTTTSHLIFLDADNYLIGPPPQTDADYTFCDLDVVADDETSIETWHFAGWPLNPHEALTRFVEARGMPFPWGGVWRTDFLKGLRWRRWCDATGYAADFRTAVDWCLQAPTLAHDPTPFMVFRSHEGQWSSRPDDVLVGDSVQDAVVRAKRILGSV